MTQQNQEFNIYNHYSVCHLHYKNDNESAHIHSSASQNILLQLKYILCCREIRMTFYFWFYCENLFMIFQAWLKKKQCLWLYSLGVYYCVSGFMKFVNLPSLCVAQTTLQEASICVGGFGMSSLETYNKESVSRDECFSKSQEEGHGKPQEWICFGDW